MATELQQQLNLPPIDQVGFVYRDVEAAAQRMAPIFGSFEIQNYGDMEWNYRGRQEVSELKIAFAKSGEVEIELIEWVSGGTPHKEFIDAGREGMHHVRFLVTNLEQKIAEAEAFGYRSIWDKRFGDGLAAAYLECQDEPLLVEFFENHSLLAP